MLSVGACSAWDAHVAVATPLPAPVHEQIERSDGSDYFVTSRQLELVQATTLHSSVSFVRLESQAPSWTLFQDGQVQGNDWHYFNQAELNLNVAAPDPEISAFLDRIESAVLSQQVAQTPPDQIESAVLSQQVAQTPPPETNRNATPVLDSPVITNRRQGSEILGQPSVQLQGVYVLQGSDSAARGRVNALYPVSPTALFGAVVDLTTGDAFSDSPGTGLRLNELYFAYAPFEKLPGLRFVVGLMDLTSYFDRNSFAKDGASHFFNRAFQTNPALSAAGLASRPGLLMNWSVTDQFEIKAAGFSSRRHLGELTLDSFAAEAGYRIGNFIARGTFVTSRDSEQETGFEEIYSLPRGRGNFGLLSDDRETAFGLNAEYFIPSLKLGLFGRYGEYRNETLGEGGKTYSFGVTRLDLFTYNDRLGIAYGQQLSNHRLWRESGNKLPDVLEIYYDLPVAKFLRVGVTFQGRDQFSEIIVGFRVKTEFSILGRLFR